MIIPVYQIGNTPGKGNAFFISITSLHIQDQIPINKFLLILYSLNCTFALRSEIQDLSFFVVKAPKVSLELWVVTGNS